MRIGGLAELTSQSSLKILGINTQTGFSSLSDEAAFDPGISYSGVAGSPILNYTMSAVSTNKPGTDSMNDDTNAINLSRLANGRYRRDSILRS